MLKLTRTQADLVTCLAAPAPLRGVVLAWLGQAGFLMRTAAMNIVIDPYLSDSLAEKYRGKIFPHERMMPAPIDPEALQPIDIVLCTHGHTDHMDAATLGPLVDANSNCQFVMPAAEYGKAVACGVPADRIFPVDVDDLLQMNESLAIDVIASAHERIERDDAGRHHFLGYVLRFGDITIYHSGDTVDYAGLDERLSRCDIDLALLPCNGRDAFRREHGVPGNMNIDEAADLCRRAGINDLVPHHFGLFDFNTANPSALRSFAEVADRPRITLPRVGEILTIARESVDQRSQEQGKPHAQGVKS